MTAPMERAARLLGYQPDRVSPVTRGGNNRLFRVEAGDKHFALKLYPNQTADPRDRLGREWGALIFLRQAGIPRVPAPLARDDAAQAALYQWMEGAPPAPGSDQAAAMAAFFQALQSHRCQAARLGPGSTPVHSLAQAEAQFHERLAGVEGVVSLKAHLSDLEIAWKRATTRAVPVWKDPSPPVLSPSDFGLHNMLIGADGPVFLDFEYFGWDGPEKAICDAMLHPGSAFPEPVARRLGEALVHPLLADDPGLPRRLEACLPLFALLWCLILLNAFRSDHMARRGLVPDSAEARADQARQLLKSRQMLERCHDFAAP